MFKYKIKVLKLVLIKKLYEYVMSIFRRSFNEIVTILNILYIKFIVNVLI